MVIAIIQFPGSNCETESLRAVRNVGMDAEEFLWNRNSNDLKKFDGYIIVGGFSYEDRSRSGIIAALDPLIPYLRSEAEKGKPVLGICNGAQILVETGLVPGLKNYTVGMALAENKRVQQGRVLGTGYYNAWVQMKLAVPSTRTAFTKNLKMDEILEVPIAHGEGRFIIPAELLNEMKAKGQTTFRYCDTEGGTSEEFPTNPNGAAYNLAAVSNAAGNVLAMMPHPERRSDMGQAIFESMRDYIEDNKQIVIAPSTANHPSPLLGEEGKLLFTPPQITIPNYVPPAHSFEIITELIITDNEAKTVETTLNQLGIPVTVERITQWEVTTEPDAPTITMRSALIDSGELFNPNKERLVETAPQPERNDLYLLVRYRDDLTGEQKKQAVRQRLSLASISAITKGSLWKITAQHDTIPNLLEKILASNILFNQFSQECYLGNF